jgi:spoIIIJ-associated protein
VEWVETTGRTVEDAKEAALDQLGVDESDAEFEVVEEARAGLFGRLRGEARVRARVRPTAPRAKDDRRDRRRRARTNGENRSGVPGANGDDAPSGSSRDSRTDADSPGAATRLVPSSSAPSGGAAAADGSAAVAVAVGSSSDLAGSENIRRGDDNGGPADATRSVGSTPGRKNKRQEGANVDVALDEQGQIGQEFLTELVAEFGLKATVRVVRPDEETVDLQLEGSDLGLLIGPRGATLLALQDLTRTVVHHRTGATNGRLHVDVGGYRQKRTEALARFAQQVASAVQASGTRTVLEPMTAADRKVVHDAITPIDGVSTISEGEEPQRRVVVVPANP